MRRFFLILLIGIITAVLLFSVFNANRAYAGTCSAPTQSQLLSMTTGTQVYNALDCVSQSDLNNLLNSLTPDQLYSVTTLMNTTQLDGVMGILNSDQIGYLIYPFTEPQLNTFLTDLGPAETYNFLDNITANPPVSQAQLTYDSIYPLLNVKKNRKTNPQDLVNMLTSIGQYNNSYLYNILNILNVSSKKSPGTNYLYDILYPLSSSQLYSILSLLTPTQLYNLLSNLPEKSLYKILTSVLSSTDLYNLFSGANYGIFNTLVNSLKWWQQFNVWLSYWAGSVGINLFGGHSNSTKLPPGSQKNTPPPAKKNPYPPNSGGPGIGNQPPGGGGNNTPPPPPTASACNKNSSANVYNCNINITIATQAPNEPFYWQSSGVSVTVANPQ